MARLVNIDRKIEYSFQSGSLENFWLVYAVLNFVLSQRDWLRTFRLCVSEALVGGW